MFGKARSHSAVHLACGKEMLGGRCSGSRRWHRCVSGWWVVRSEGSLPACVISQRGGRGPVSPGEAPKGPADLSPEQEAWRWTVCVSSWCQTDVG